MNCNCQKNLGCYLPNDTIDFGINAPCDGDYEFQIFGPSGVSLVYATFLTGDPLTLGFTFNENGESMIKIKVPVACQHDGFYYITSKDGACCFIVNGAIPVC